MATDARVALIDLLTEEFGAEIELDFATERLTAHFALRAVEWVLEAAGSTPEMSRHEEPRRLARSETVTAVCAAHKRRYDAWIHDDDMDSPETVEGYVGVLEEVLGVDLAILPVPTLPRVPARFAAPDGPAIEAITCAYREFSDHDPDTWLIQRRVGRYAADFDLDDDLDRFIAHWSYRRDYPNPWVEINRGDALRHMTAVQRKSLVWSAPPFWDPGEKVARSRAEDFLYVFDLKRTRFFTNGDGYRSRNLHDGNYFRITGHAMFETGVVAIGPRYAGLWWHAEGDRATPLGMSP